MELPKVTAVVQNVTPAALSADNWFGRNKTKILGLLVITVGYLQLPANLDVLLEYVGPRFFPLVNMGLGLAALWVGFLNNPEPTIKKE